MPVIKTLFAVLTIVGTTLLSGCGNGAGEGNAPSVASSPTHSSLPSASLPPELLDVDWHLQSFGRVGDEDLLLPDTGITIKLGANGQVSGSTGCNNFSTTYASDGGATLSLRAMATTRMMCPQPIMSQEYEVSLALGAVETFESTDDELLLFYDGGNSVLVFRRSAEDRGAGQAPPS